MGHTLFLDGYNLVIRNFAVNPVRRGTGHFGMVFGSLTSLRYTVDNFMPTKVVFCWDGEGSKELRREFYPEYKMQRDREPWNPDKKRAFPFKSKDEEHASFSEQLQRFREYLEKLPIHVIDIDRTEADDIIAHGAVYEYDNGNNVTIVSTDKDYIQLCRTDIEKRIACFNPITKKTMTSEKFQKEHGFPVCNYLLVRAVEGDTSDNIAPIKRSLGLKKRFAITEKTLLKSFPEIEGSNEIPWSDIVYDSKEKVDSDGLLVSERSVYAALVDSADTLSMNYKLMDLENPLLTDDQKETVENILDSGQSSFDRTKLRMMFREDKMTMQIKRWGYWIETFVRVKG